MTVTFHNITITLEAVTPKEAYNALCELLDKYNKRCAGGIGWETDTYSVGGGDEAETNELWPE